MAMSESPNLLYSRYIIDGEPKAVTPAFMLQECSLTEELIPDGDFPVIADETADPGPATFVFSEEKIQQYLSLFPFKRSFPLAFPGEYSSGKIAQALIDAIWMSGHFRLGDLSVKADWHWSSMGLGYPAAFYRSVEQSCQYMDQLGIKFSRYSLLKGGPSVSFKADTVAEEDAPEEDESLFRELPYRTSNPKISRRRKCPASLQPSSQDWIVYIPFDSCDYRLGGSALAEAVGASPATPADVSDADYFIDCYEVVRELVEDGVVLAGCTVGDGGLLPALKSMCGGGTGADVYIGDICRAAAEEYPVRVLFAEVPGVLIQIADSDYDYVDAELLLQDVAFFPIGHPVPGRPQVQLTGKTGIPDILESLLNTLEGED